jgi:poly(A) polymerase
MNTTNKNIERQIAEEICWLLQYASFKAYFAGGYVRDSILGIESNDIDIATSAPPKYSMPLLQAKGFSTKFVGESFGVVLAKKGDYEFEVATFRKDVNCDGRHPESVVFATAEEDAQRRDFTINALFYDPITREYHDFVGGMGDLNSHTIRFVGNPEQRIKEDYLRILRMLRFWSRGFNIDKQTLLAAQCFGNFLSMNVAPDRIMKEFKEKILPSGRASQFFRIMVEETPSIAYDVFPELLDLKDVPQNPVWHPEGDALEHTLRVVAKLEEGTKDPCVILAGVFHDLGKATQTRMNDEGKLTSLGHEHDSEDFTREIMLRQKWSNEDIDHVTWLVGNHMKLHFEGLSKSTLRKLMASPYFDDLLLLTRADDLGSNGDTSILDAYVERIKGIEVVSTRVLPKPLVTGNTLIGLGLKPSPLFKILLDAAMDRQLEGDITSEDEGVFFIKKALDEKTYE